MAKTGDLWAQLLSRCLRRRIQGEQFETLARQLFRRSPIIGIKLADILLDRQQQLPGMLDPLIPVYAESFLEHGRISSADLLASLYKHSKASIKTASQDEQTPEPLNEFTRNTAEIESCIFDVLTKAYLPEGGRPVSQDETRIGVKLLAQWLDATVAAGAALVQEVDHRVIVETLAVIDSLGSLSIAILENQKVIGIIDAALHKDIRKKLAHSLSSFTTFWSQASPQHTQNAARLDMAQKARSLINETSTESHEAAFDVAAAVQVEAVVDLQTIHTRPHVFIFISALLSGCPLTDESMMMNYLHVRYGGDAQSLATDLIAASFDVLAAAADRNESSQVMFGLKSFLINKIPTLIITLTGSLLTPEFAINEALSKVELNMFPTVGLGMLQSNTTLQDTRQDFVYACILHGLLPADSVGRLLGESTFDSPPSPEKRYHRNILLQLCSTEPGKAVSLVAELEKLDGNAGAIVGAVTEVIRSSCVAKDTMSLKSICNALSSRPQVLDVMLQFASPASILQPLCQLLDAWRYEDDQGEYQPVYDEFASIFLLVLAFIYRYEFSHAHLGISSDSFVAKYLAQGHRESVLDQLTEEQSKHLESWVKGLFDPDGITEEVTASCRPQQFYMLAPTIFCQTMLACSAGVLTIDGIKGGLEYLYEPFLMPSLVDAVYWLTAYSREQPGQDVDILIKMLQRITRSPSSGDAQPMHSTIMAIIALPLANCLRTLQNSSPKLNDVRPMLETLRQHSDFRRGPYSPCQEMQAWTVPPGLRHTIRTTFQNLINWSLQATQINPAQLPPHYNHRLFVMAERILGAPDLLSLLLEEVKQQTDNPAGAAAVAMDIATAIICAPRAENSPIDVGWVNSPVPAHQPHNAKRLNLREALVLEIDRATDIMKTDQTMAETVIRLHRRVDVQCAIGVAPLPDITTQMPTILPTLDLSTSQNTAVVPQQMDFTADTTGMDLGGTDSMQMDLTVPDDDGMGMGMGMLSGNAEDDVFGDLDLSNMGDLGDMDYGF